VANQNEELESRVKNLEEKVAQLMANVNKVRKVREFTDEQRAAIRARLLAGQEAAKKKKVGEKVTSKPQMKKVAKPPETQPSSNS
jgi:hypothetical protein